METLIIMPKKEDELEAVKSIFKVLKIKFKTENKIESPYNTEFVKKIKRSEKNFKDGKFKIIKTEDIWK